MSPRSAGPPSGAGEEVMAASLRTAGEAPASARTAVEGARPRPPLWTGAGVVRRAVGSGCGAVGGRGGLRGGGCRLAGPGGLGRRPRRRGVGRAAAGVGAVEAATLEDHPDGV